MFGLVPFAKNISNKDDDFNSLFDVFNEPFFHNALSPFSTAKSFKVDVKDLGSAYELTAELPGIKKENISLSYENSYLTIKVANKEEKTVDDKEKQSEKYLRRERYYGEMQRSFYIDDIDEANVKAAYKDGILTVKSSQKRNGNSHKY